jgi:cytochrome oxidase Cu insertion factor (SCO1/SenC/PrrC family)
MNWLKISWASSLIAMLLGLIFSIPFFALDSFKPVRAEFLNPQGNDKAIVFFGFTHCADICPTTLAVLRQLLSSPHNSTQWPQIAFIDIDRNSNPQNAELYAHQFHSEFIGLHPSPEHMAKLKADFGLNFQQNGSTIAHQGRTYLLNKNDDQWYIVKTYNPDTFDATTLAEDLY